MRELNRFSALPDTDLVIHELEGEGRLPHPSTAHHDHFVEGQRVLSFGLRSGHGSDVEARDTEGVGVKQSREWVGVTPKQ